MPEKLLERAVEKGALFCSVQREGERGLLVCCDANSAEILLNECARFNLPAETLSRRGRSAVIAYMRRRVTLPVGLMLCLALCWLFLGRIWLVDAVLTGENAALGDIAALRDAVEAEGVRPGMGRDIDLSLLGQRLQAKSDAYSYVGARLRGVRLLIEAVPETPSPRVYDVAAARDLVSNRDGIVLSAVAQSGELCVQPGDAVRRGQLLIRGEELSGKEETQAIAALGEVRVRTWYTGEAALPLSATRTVYTGKSSASSRLKTPWLSVDITEGEAYAQQVEQAERLPIGGLFVPVEIERVTRREVAYTRISRDREQLQALLTPLAFADAALKLASEGPEAYEILDQWIDFSPVGGMLRARAVYEISANAAVTREALIDDANNS